MAYKLAIDPLVSVLIQGHTTDAKGVAQRFKFHLVCERLASDDLLAAIADKDENVIAFFHRVARDWVGQRLVLNAENNEPAEFSQEALAVLMSISGMGRTCWLAYNSQLVVHE